MRRKKTNKPEDKGTPEYDFQKIKKIKSQKGISEESNVIRLNRFLANAGICSRREADELIESGKIKVNGKLTTALGTKVHRFNDRVVYKGKVISAEKKVYLLLNKPKDFITTVKDPKERKTVMELVKNACTERIYPVGRLDRNTTGLLLFTNDGSAAKKLTHPSSEVKKIYQVTLSKPLSENDYDAITNGIELDDGPIKIDDIAIVSPDNKTIGVELHSGRNRIVRRIFEHLGYEIVSLDRVSFAGLTKKNLPRGNWRFLTEKEVISLKIIK